MSQWDIGQTVIDGETRPPPDRTVWWGTGLYEVVPLNPHAIPSCAHLRSGEDVRLPIVVK